MKRIRDMKNLNGAATLWLVALAVGLLLGTADPAVCADTYTDVAMVVQTQSLRRLLVDIQVSVFSEAGLMLGTCFINQLLGSPYSKTASCLITLKPGQKITGWEWKGKVSDERPGGAAFYLSGQRRTQQEMLILYDGMRDIIQHKYSRIY